MANLDHFIAQVRAALDRGLPINAEDVVDGLEYAIQMQRENEPVHFELGVMRIENRVRLWQAKLDRRDRLDIDYTYRGPQK